MKWLRQYRLGGVGLTLVLLVLIALAVTQVANYFVLVMLVGVVGCVAGFHVMFRGSRWERGGHRDGG